jgi:hypothetical protein
VAQLTTYRDVSLPDTLLQYSELRGQYVQFGKTSAENQRLIFRELFGVENNIKRWRGMLKALNDPALLDAKRRAEADLRARVAANPQLSREIGDPWKEIADAQVARAGLDIPQTMLETRAGFGSDLFYYARHLVRAAEERAKPNSERLPQYADARLPLLEKTLLDPEPVDAGVETLKLEFWLTKLREFMTADAPQVAIFLGKDSPANVARHLSTSRLADPALRKQLWDGGMAAIRASNDPMIQFVLKTDAASRAIRKEYETKVEGPVDRAAERLARARFAILGTSVYPDATFTLRISYGQVTGWNEFGRTIPAFTQYRGLFARATGEPPFDLAPRWVGAETTVDLDTVFNISSSNDILGGNSGSPLINARGEVVGAAFDGNIWSLGGSFAYDPALNRTVSVSTASVTEALRKMYNQPALLAELTAP